MHGRCLTCVDRPCVEPLKQEGVWDQQHFILHAAVIFNRYWCSQLAMRSLCPEHFSTLEVVLHTCGPIQTVAKYVPYRWSINYLFVLRGANKMYYVLFKTIHYI